MIKSTISNSETTTTKLPHLFTLKDIGDVVLFTEENKGIVVYKSNKSEAASILYRCQDNWVSCWDQRIWTPFKSGESVTLTAK